MFLTRSKTSSAICEDHCVQETTKANGFPVIPIELISILEASIPAIDNALKPILDKPGHDLLINMISTWVISSRIAGSNLKMNNVKPKSLSLRTWATRSFPNRSKSILVAPATQQKHIIEISERKNLSLKRVPSLTNSLSSDSSFSTASFQEDHLDKPTMQHTTLDHKKMTSQLPVSLKSMIDLLDTPPLIPSDARSLSLIDESLTPLSSNFFHSNDLLEHVQESFNVGSSLSKAESGAIISLKDPKLMKRSFSTVIFQIGHSVKKAFKKKSQPSSVASVTGSKVSSSAQNQLTTSRDTSTRNESLYTPITSSDEKTPEEPLPYKRPEAKAYAAAFATFMSTGKIDKSLANVYGGNSTINSEESSLYSALSDTNEHDSTIQTYPMTKEANQDQQYWNGEDTQSQQFDKLLDDIYERSQEYQEYFGEEQKMRQSINSFNSTFNTYLKNTLWSPVDDGQPKITVRPSKTEGNMINLQDTVPFVCVGKQRNEDMDGETITSSRRVSHLPQKMLNIEDVKAYKRSTSAISNIKDYDLNWQKSFHMEQKSRDKVSGTLKSVSWAFYDIIKKNHIAKQFECDAIFDENESALESSEYSQCTDPLIEWNDIYDQMAYVFECGELTAEHAIITFIYVKRMLDSSNQKLWDLSWRMIVMSSLLTAVKVWDDCAIFNADFAMIFPELSVDVINNIERMFLTHLQWDVSVSCTEFAKTYFYLRDVEQRMDQW